MTHGRTVNRGGGFSLVEVLLAVGVFAFAVLGLVGMLGPLLSDLRAAREEARAEALMAAARERVREEALTGVADFAAPAPERVWLYAIIAAANGAERSVLADFAAEAALLLPAVGERYAGDLFELRAIPLENTAGSHHAWTVEVRRIPPPPPDTNPADLAARFEALSPSFVFPLLARP